MLRIHTVTVHKFRLERRSGGERGKVTEEKDEEKGVEAKNE